MKNFKATALVSALAIAGAAFAPGFAFAAQRTGTLAVTATVTDSCVVTGGTLAFGNVDVFGAAVNATTNLTARCTTGSLYTIGLGAGNAVGATTATRAMMNTTASLAYGLFTDPAHTLNWDEIAGTNVASGTGNGADQLIPVYGRVPAGQSTVLTGAYTDSVVVTVDF